MGCVKRKQWIRRSFHSKCDRLQRFIWDVVLDSMSRPRPPRLRRRFRSTSKADAVLVRRFTLTPHAVALASNSD